MSEATAKRREGWDESSYFRPSWCAAEVQRSPAWLYSLIAAGEIRAVRVKGCLRVPRSEWERWLAANTEPAA